jgi:hypothetical protein
MAFADWRLVVANILPGSVNLTKCRAWSPSAATLASAPVDALRAYGLDIRPATGADGGMEGEY